MARVILFDIDGTLVDAGGVGSRAMMRGVAKALGVGPEEVEVPFSFAGMTDRAILRRFLGGKVDPRDLEPAMDRAMGAYVEAMREEVEVEDGEVAALAGTEVLIEELSGRRGVALGLGTGNAREGAALKLNAAGLGGRFKFGGYGDEWECREALIAGAMDRGARALGLGRERCQYLVVGDTPADVKAAKANGAQSLAVTSGGTSHEALAGYGPTMIVEGLDRISAEELVGSPGLWGGD